MSIAAAATSVWDGLVGHEDVRRSFARVLQAGRWSQSYLLVGPDGVGKFELARRLAQVLLCRHRDDAALDACGQCESCRPFLAGAHPDYLVIERDAGRRELTVDKFIGSRDERGQVGLCHDLSLRPLAGSRKVAIIRDADTMNDESANALLKTLEEPPPGAVLLLVAANLDLLLPTIRSRCQTVRFQPLSDADVACLLRRQGLAESDDDARTVAAMAGGSLTRAGQLLSPQLRAVRQTLVRELTHGKWSAIALARSLYEGLEDVASDVPGQRQAALWLIRSAMELFRDGLRQLALSTNGRDEAPWLIRGQSQPTETIEALGEAIDRCLQAEGEIDQNAGVALCLEAWLLDLSRLPHLRG